VEVDSPTCPPIIEMGSHYNGRRDLILDEREIEKRIS